MHPGSGGHVPYSPAFHHHHSQQHHVRPIGIANVMPRQEQQQYQRQSSVGTCCCHIQLAADEYLMIAQKVTLLISSSRTVGCWHNSTAI